MMGFAWLVTVVMAAWVFFVLGRKYQDLQDVLLARRVAKLIDQRVRVSRDLAKEAEMEDQILIDKQLDELEKRRTK